MWIQASTSLGPGFFLLDHQTWQERGDDGKGHEASAQEVDAHNDRHDGVSAMVVAKNPRSWKSSRAEAHRGSSGNYTASDIHWHIYRFRGYVAASCVATSGCYKISLRV
jgi:hypothetical protein